MAKKKTDPEQVALARVEAERLNSILGFGSLFNASLEKMEPYEKAIVWSLLDLFKDLAKERCDEAREALFVDAEAVGVKTEKGHFTIEMEDGTTVTKERRQRSNPSEDHVKMLLEKYRIPLAEAFSEKKSFVLDPSKLQHLVDTGKLPSAEVEEGKGVTWALKVKASTDLATALEGVQKMIEKVKPPKELKAAKKASK